MVKMKSKRRGSLKNALSSTQARLKNKKQAEAKGVSGKRRGESRRGSTNPFKASDRILLIGEGNFSFALALLRHPLDHLPPANIVATTLDAEEECYTKYPDAEENVRELREKGARVLFGVDATRLDKTSVLKGKVFDRIVWNFPHAGKGITDQDRNILSNQVLILGFLRSAARFLVRGPAPQMQTSRKRERPSSDDEDGYTDGDKDQSVDGRTRGTILITLRNVPPYTEWDVPKLAKSPPAPRTSADVSNPHYVLFRSFVFKRGDWKGYEHRMTKGEGKTGEGGEDRTWEFFLRDE